jgi:hypothetical protein
MKSLTALILVLALWLTLVLGCNLTGTKNGNSDTPVAGKCDPVELFIQTPEGGDLVPGVTVARDGNGNLTAKWKTTLPAGTQSMIDVGLWKPDKKKDIEYGPLLDGAGIEKTSCDGSVISNTEPYTNDGKGFNQGRYYLTLTVIDNSIWKQPEATKATLAAAKGKVKAVGADSLGGKQFGVKLDLMARFELPACAVLQATGPPPPPTPLTRGQTEAIVRKLYAQVLENKMAKMGHPVRVTVGGEDNTTITVESPDFTRESVMAQAANEEFMAPFRKQHFKRVEFTDGVNTWGINLK